MSDIEFRTQKWSIKTEVLFRGEWSPITEVWFREGKVGIKNTGHLADYSEIEAVR